MHKNKLEKNKHNAENINNLLTNLALCFIMSMQNGYIIKYKKLKITKTFNICGLASSSANQQVNERVNQSIRKTNKNETSEAL